MTNQDKNLDLNKVAAVRIDQEKETVTILNADGSENCTIDIIEIDWIGNSVFSPIYQLKLALSRANFKVLGGWFFLNQTVVWEANNPEFERGMVR